jgi:hypothetical protein
MNDAEILLEVIKLLGWSSLTDKRTIKPNVALVKSYISNNNNIFITNVNQKSDLEIITALSKLLHNNWKTIIKSNNKGYYLAILVN